MVATLSSTSTCNTPSFTSSLKKNAIEVNGNTVEIENGLLLVTDIYVAANKPRNKSFSKWRDLASTNELLFNISNNYKLKIESLICIILDKGVFVHSTIAVAYAKWLNNEAVYNDLIAAYPEAVITNVSKEDTKRNLLRQLHKTIYADYSSLLQSLGVTNYSTPTRIISTSLQLEGKPLDEYSSTELQRRIDQTRKVQQLLLAFRPKGDEEVTKFMKEELLLI